MLKRFAALIFLIGIFGQAWASACICDNPMPVHSCCERKAEKNDYLAPKGCCDGENCLNQRSATAAASLNQPTTISTETAAAAPSFTLFTTPKLYSAEPFRETSATGSYRYRPRPPDLYVRHHAFLI